MTTVVEAGKEVQVALDVTGDPSLYNHIPNPRFEIDTSKWTAIGGAQERVTTEKLLGSACNKLTPTSPYVALVSDPMSLSPREHTVSAHVKGPAKVDLSLENDEPWGYGGPNPVKSAGSPAIIDFDAMGLYQHLNLPLTDNSAGITTDEVNLLKFNDHDQRSGPAPWSLLYQNEGNAYVSGDFDPFGMGSIGVYYAPNSANASRLEAAVNLSLSPGDYVLTWYMPDNSFGGNARSFVSMGETSAVSNVTTSSTQVGPGLWRFTTPFTIGPTQTGIERFRIYKAVADGGKTFFFSGFQVQAGTVPTPFVPSFRITDDIDVRAHFESLVSNGEQTLVARYGSTGTTNFMFTFNSANSTLRSRISVGGVNILAATSAPTSAKHVRWTRQGATNRFYTSPDGHAWTQLGNDIAATTGTLDGGSTPLTIGKYSSASFPFNGRIFSAQVRAGIDGPDVLDFKAESAPLNSPSFTATNNRVFYLNGTASIVSPKALWLPGTVGNLVSTPDINEVDYNSSTIESGVGKWDGLNKNLINAEQSSFESSLAGWESNNSNTTISRSTLQAHAGTASMALTAAASGAISARTPYAAGVGIPVIPGQVYTTSLMSRAGSTSRLFAARIRWVNASGVGLSISESIAVANNNQGWTQASVVAQAPEGAVLASLLPYVLDSSAGEVHYFDSIGLFETPNANLLPGGGDFENDLTGAITNIAGSLSLSTTDSYTGRSSALLTTTASGINRVSIATSVIAGVTYTFSARMKGPVGRAIHGNYFQSASGHGSIPATTFDGTWQYVTGTRSFVQTGSATLFLGVTDPAGAGEKVYIDSVQVVAASTAPEYLPPVTVNLEPNPRDFATTHTNAATSGGPTRTSNFATAPDNTTTASRINSTSGYRVSFKKWIGLTPEAPYTVSAWFKNNGGHVETFFYGKLISMTNDWVRHSTTVIADQNGEVFNGVTNSSRTPTDHLIWGLQFEAGSVATPYVDGTLGAAYVWESSDNLISNPSFETNTVGWEGLNKNLLTANQSNLESGGTPWVAVLNCSVDNNSTAVAFEGTKSLSMTATSAGDMRTGLAHSSSSYIPVVPGQIYTASAQVRAGSTARPVTVYVEWRNNSLVSEGSGGHDTVASHSTGWTLASGVCQAPANATYARVIVSVAGASAGEVHYVDAVGFFETPSANLFSNSDFETGSDGYSYGATPTLSNDAYVGRQSVRVALPANSLNNSQIIMAPTMTLMPGTYTAQMRIKSTAGSPFHMRATGTGVVDPNPTTGSVVTATGGWDLVSVTFTSNGGGCQIAARTNAAQSEEVPYLIDAVQMVVGSQTVEYLPPTTTNLVPNPSFEVNTTGWTGFAATISRDTSMSSAGAASGKVTATGSANAYAKYDIIPIPEGVKTVTVSGSVRDVDGGISSASVYVYFIVNGAEQTTDPARVGPGFAVDSSSWTRISHTRTVPAGATGLTFIGGFPTAKTSTATGRSFLIDAWQVEFGSVPTPYVDGSLGPGYVWESSDNILSVAQSTFEGAGPYNWSPSTNSTSPVSSTSQSFQGTQSLTFSPGANGAECRIRHASALPSLVTGKTYTFSFYARGTAGKNCRLRVYWASGDTLLSGNPSVDSAVSPIGDYWQRYTVTATVPAGATSASISMHLDGTLLTTDVFFIDAVQLEARTYATPFGQNSTPHASTSRRQQPWVPGGTSIETISRSAIGVVSHGTQAMLVRPITPKGMEVHTHLTTGVETFVDVTPSTTYTISATTAEAFSVIRVIDALTGSQLSVSSVPVTAGSRRQFATFATNASTTKVRIQIVRAQPTVFDAFYVDGVQLEQKSYATPFGANGAAHASTSRRHQPWIIGGSSFTLFTPSTGPHEQGTYGMLVRPDWYFGGKGQEMLHNLAYPTTGGIGYVANVNPNATYTFSSYVYREAAVRLRVLDMNTGATLGTTVWTGIGRVSVTFTTGATTSQVRLQFERDTSSRLTQYNWYVDAVQLERGGTASPYAVPTRIIGDVDLRARLWRESWNGAATAVGSWAGGTNYLLRMETNRTLRLFWRPDNATTFSDLTSSEVLPFAVDTTATVRATLDVDNGAGGHTARFYYSLDGVTWTELGTPRVGAGITNINNVLALVQVGIYGPTLPLKGCVLSAEVRAGIDGPIVAHYDALQHIAETYTDTTGKVWTIGRSGNATAEIVNNNTWAFTGTEYLNMPDRSELNPGTSDFTFAISISGSRSVSGYLAGKGALNTTGLGSYLFDANGRFFARNNNDQTTSVNSVPAGTGTNGSKTTLIGSRGENGVLRQSVNGTIYEFGTTIPGEVSNTYPLFLGKMVAGALLSGFLQWSALFMRVLTNAEHLELGTWNGKVATEPSWLRTAAIFYVNADDKRQREAYKTNAVINLARFASLSTNIGPGWNRLIVSGEVAGNSRAVITADRQVHVDGVMVHSGDPAEDYADGSFGWPWFWTGAADNSISFRPSTQLRRSSTTGVEAYLGDTVLIIKNELSPVIQ